MSTLPRPTLPEQSRRGTAPTAADVRQMLAELIESVAEADHWRSNPAPVVEIIDLLLRDQVHRLVTSVFDTYRAEHLDAFQRRGHLALLPAIPDLLP